MQLSTAIKSIWLLYRRGKWDLLTSLGLIRSNAEPVFEWFDNEIVVNQFGLLTQEYEIVHLIKAHKPIVYAALLVQRRLVEGITQW